MKTLSQDEIKALDRVREDVDITLDKQFSGFEDSVRQNLRALSPIYVAIYFRALNHDPKNSTWRNRDYVFSTNNYANFVENIVKVHAGYVDFSQLTGYLEREAFWKVENTFGDAIGHYIADQDTKDKHQKYYYIISSSTDLLNSISALEFILKNELSRIIILATTNNQNEKINQENKLNGRLINLGFDTLVVNGNNPGQICEAIQYAKELSKPTVILANLN